jgi:hypothetical protein
MLELLQSFTLFGSVIGFYIAVLLLIGLLFYSDIEEQGYGAFFSFLIFVGVTYFWSNFNILFYFSWELICSYLGIGLLYSFIKTYFFARKKGEDGRKYIKENVFRWWFLWPVSLINWILSDIIRDLYNLVYNKLSRLYDGIFNLGLKNND